MASITDYLIRVPGAVLENPVREAETYGWQTWIKSATGEEATVNRQKDKNVLVWKPGQAEKFSQYFDDMIFPSSKKEEKKKRGLGFGEVEINWRPVYMPLVIKRVLPVVALYTVIAFFAGRLTKRK